MKNLTSRMAAVAGLIAFLGLYGCNEDGQSSDQGGGTVAAASRPSFQAVSSAMKTGAAASQASNAADNPVAAAEQAKADSNKTFDGSADHSSLASSGDDAVKIPASSGKKDVAYTAAPAKTELDTAADAPPAPAKDPQVAACEKVLAAHDQDFSGCQPHPKLSLEWGGFKNAFSEQLGSVTAVASTLVFTAVGMLLSGGLSVLAKVLKLLLIGAGALMLVKEIGSLYQAVKALLTQDKGSEEYAQGVWQVTKSVTTIGIMAGAFGIGAKKGAGAPAQGELPLAEKPGTVARAWQSVRGWFDWQHA